MENTTIKPNNVMNKIESLKNILREKYLHIGNIIEASHSVVRTRDFDFSWDIEFKKWYAWKRDWKLSLLFSYPLLRFANNGNIYLDNSKYDEETEKIDPSEYRETEFLESYLLVGNIPLKVCTKCSEYILKQEGFERRFVCPSCDLEIC